MVIHTVGYTYAPKEEAVRLGHCRQTIRKEPERKIRCAGDEVLHHGWTGIPYRSPWSWRLRAPLTEVLRITAELDGFTETAHECYSIETDKRCDRPIVYDTKVPWDSYYADMLARFDWSRPACGLELREVLKSLKTLGKEPIRLEVLRW